MTEATRLPAETPLFNVPTGLVRILDRDLKAAGIAKKDDRGRTVDVHAMRMTYGTMLSKAGVAPCTAQAALRHSSIDLTMNVYTDPKLLDVAGALDSLPALPLSGGPQGDRIAVKATGTADYRSSQFAPTADKPSKSWSSPDQSAPAGKGPNAAPRNVASDDGIKEKRSLTNPVSERHLVERKGVEPSTSALRTQEASFSNDDSIAFDTSSAAACTVACTSEAENVNDGTDSLAALAAVLTSLDPTARAKLAAMLLKGS